ncbi:MAG: glutamyl-tRNA reductase [Planctomycetes bacterium]|nr:glutamyl-tRNA reductase [Planctomycetota bacterium]
MDDAPLVEHEVVCLSVNHRCADLAARERLVFGAEEAAQAMTALREAGAVDEVVLVSTCNRTEIFAAYAIGEDAAAVGATPARDGDRSKPLLAILEARRGFRPEEHPRNYETARGIGAIRHLFRVAAGLESQLLGESQVLSQLKDAGRRAREAGTSGRILHRLWERALRVGKRVRTETALGEGPVSASYAALELARKVFGSLAELRILVIGAGEIGLLTMENLTGVPHGALTIMNRTREEAEQVAARFGGRVRSFDELSDALIEADLVISTTAAPHFIVGFDHMRRVRARRGGERPLLIIDLALPRDFDPRCGALDLVFLHNLDDLAQIVGESQEQRRRELPRAEEIVEEECEGFSEWMSSLAIEPTILGLRERFEAIRAEELERVRGDLEPAAFAALERTTRRLVNRLLHLPSENLRRHRALRDRDLVRVVHEVLTKEIPHPRQEEERPGS